jgi:hypothetical protein
MFWRAHLQPFTLRGPYKVFVGGLLELLLGTVTNVCIWGSQYRRWGSTDRSPSSVPGEKVPSNTWLISMIAGGRACAGVKESKRGI